MGIERYDNKAPKLTPDPVPDQGLFNSIVRERARYQAILGNLVRTIEDTGGVFHNAKGLYEPAGDRDWIYLGQVYVEACRALNHAPKVVDEHA